LHHLHLTTIRLYAEGSYSLSPRTPWGLFVLVRRPTCISRHRRRFREARKVLSFSVEAEVDVFAPILHEFGGIFVLRIGEGGLIVLDFAAGHFAADRDEGDVTLGALEHGAAFAQDCAVVGVKVSGYVPFWQVGFGEFSK